MHCAEKGSGVSSAGCRVCGKENGHDHFRIREMFFGSRETFDYFECSYCGTIQIRDIPSYLGRYYPDGYYSFTSSCKKSTSRIGVALRRLRSDAWLAEGSRIGRALARLSKRKPVYVEWFSGTRVNTGSRIVDVGCGSGRLLLSLQRDGFRHLAGLDPFIDGEIDYGGGLKVHMRSLAMDGGAYDMIMMHHSFEHMPDPVAAMTSIAQHLAPDGRALIRIPIAGGYAWRTYRENWFQLDAPRHLVIPSFRAMYMLAEMAGLEVERYFFDSKAEQFIVSEAYRMNYPMVEQGNILPRSDEEIQRLKLLANQLNSERDGDQGGFILRRKNPSGLAG